jgi:hypothetical protein
MSGMICAVKRFALAPILLAGALLAGCNAPSCVLVGTTAVPLLIVVRDSVSRGTIVGQPLVIVTSSLFTDTLKNTYSSGINPDSVVAVFQYQLTRGLAGTYAVSITHPAYKPWSKTGIAVTGQGCTVTTVGVNAYLQPKTASPRTAWTPQEPAALPEKRR